MTCQEWREYLAQQPIMEDGPLVRKKKKEDKGRSFGKQRPLSRERIYGEYQDTVNKQTDGTWRRPRNHHRPTD